MWLDLIPPRDFRRIGIDKVGGSQENLTVDMIFSSYDNKICDYGLLTARIVDV